MKLLLALLISTFFVQAVYGFSCKCPDSLEVSHYYNQADLVVQGTVVRVTTNWMSGGWKYTFKVSQSWKRPTDDVLFVNSPWEKDCGYIFNEGDEYLVYITKGFTMKTFQCSGNILVSQANKHHQYLGQGFPPEPSSQITFMYWTISIMVGLSMVFLGFIVLKKRKNNQN